MRIKLFLNKDVNANADVYFSKAKKLKAKIPGIDSAISRTEDEILNFEGKRDEYVAKREKEKKISFHREKMWYEKFRFTFTKNGFLCVFGKDAGTNEILIKKHAENEDLVLHTEAPGSPFGVIKGGRDKAQSEDIFEAAEFLCCFSKQWKGGFGTADAFWVFPEQVSKQANSGEFMSKGSFMVRGEKHILKNIQLRICLGVRVVKIDIGDESEVGESVEVEELFSGSESACRKYCANRYVKIEPGQSNYKALTKEIKKRLKCHVEDLPKYIPNDCKILKR